MTDVKLHREYSTDFGRLLCKVPAEVSIPTTVEMLVEDFEHARSQGWKVAFRGGGQSFYGQSLCEGGMVIDLRRLTTLASGFEIHDGYVKVQAGTRLRALQRFLQEKGLRLPVYTVAPEGTVGGTLASGGISGRCFRRGLLVNSVREIELVGTDGRTWTCSETENPDIFACSVATLGGAGAIVSASLKTETLLPERVQLGLPKVEAISLPELCFRFSAAGEVASMEGYVDLLSQSVNASVYATIEAKDKTEALLKKNLWEEYMRRYRISGGSFRIFDIHADIQFSESLGGWRSTLYDLQLSFLNRQFTIFIISVPVAVNCSAVAPFLADLSAYARNHREMLSRKPYFAVIDSTPKSVFEWARLSETKAFVVGFDVFVTFRNSELARGLAVMEDIARITADHQGRLYGYSFLPKAEVLSRLLPSPDGLTRVQDKVDPGKIMKPQLPLLRAGKDL